MGDNPEYTDHLSLICDAAVHTARSHVSYFNAAREHEPNVTFISTFKDSSRRLMINGLAQDSFVLLGRVVGSVIPSSWWRLPEIVRSDGGNRAGGFCRRAYQGSGYILTDLQRLRIIFYLSSSRHTVRIVSFLVCVEGMWDGMIGIIRF